MDDAPFEPLDMFPDSMHRLLSYENMLTGVLAGSEDGVDAMDTCGFPLFSHDLQNGEEQRVQQQLADPAASEGVQAGLSTAKRSRFVADGEVEALVLEELEDVVFQVRSPATTRRRTPASQICPSSSSSSSSCLTITVLRVVLKLTKRTRMCYRDAFYRLAESSKANCSAAEVSSTQSFHGGAASRYITWCSLRLFNLLPRPHTLVVVLT
jgi:hypothetical protein